MNFTRMHLIVDSAGRGDGGPLLLFPILLLLAGFGIWYFLRRRNGLAGVGGRMGPMSTLQDRFARGEVDRQELEYRQAVLKGDKNIPPAPPAPPTARPAPPSDD